MGGDPFDSVTPIGVDRRPESLRISKREADVRRRNHRADQSDMRSATAGPEHDHHSPKTIAADPADLGSTSPETTTGGAEISLTDLKLMALDIAQRSYNDATTLTKPVERKQAATSFGIATDKVLLLANRPAQAANFLEAEERRGPLRELGLLIAGARQASA